MVVEWMKKKVNKHKILTAWLWSIEQRAIWFFRRETFLTMVSIFTCCRPMRYTTFLVVVWSTVVRFRSIFCYNINITLFYATLSKCFSFDVALFVQSHLALSLLLCVVPVLIFAWLCVSRVSTLNHHKIKTMNVSPSFKNVAVRNTPIYTYHS